MVSGPRAIHSYRFRLYGGRVRNRRWFLDVQRMDGKPMNCRQCDLPFQQIPRTSGRIREFCSVTCRTSSYKGRYKDKHYRQSYYKPKAKAAKTKVCSCVQCGKEFTGPTKRPRKTCSRECAYSRKMFTNTRYSKVHKTFRGAKREPTPKYVNPNGVCPPSYRQQLARECYK